MRRQPPRATLTVTLCPCTSLVRSSVRRRSARCALPAFVPATVNQGSHAMALEKMSRLPLAIGEPLLEVVDLGTSFDTLAGPARVGDGVSYTVRAGQTLGVVGESGCGKSVTAMSILRQIGRAHV